MIKYYYKSVRSTAVKELDEPQPGTWIHAEAPTEKEIEELAKQLNLELGHLEDAIDEDEMPRLEREGDQSYIFVRFPYKNSDGDMDTAPLLIVFDAEHVLTVSPIHLPAVGRTYQGQGRFRYYTARQAHPSYPQPHQRQLRRIHQPDQPFSQGHPFAPARHRHNRPGPHRLRDHRGRAERVPQLATAH